MGRLTTLIWMVSLTMVAFGLYLVKYAVQDVQREVAAMQGKLQEERQALHLLKAEWAYLNRPERLRKLADKHLALVPLDSRRIERIDALPASYEAPEADGPVAREANYIAGEH